MLQISHSKLASGPLQSTLRGWPIHRSKHRFRNRINFGCKDSFKQMPVSDVL